MRLGDSTYWLVYRASFAAIRYRPAPEQSFYYVRHPKQLEFVWERTRWLCNALRQADTKFCAAKVHIGASTELLLHGSEMDERWMRMDERWMRMDEDG